MFLANSVIKKFLIIFVSVGGLFYKNSNNTFM